MQNATEVIFFTVLLLIFLTQFFKCSSVDTFKLKLLLG
ncbi:uncharacterized protein METZ01_LOCUS162696, partial [marine metagenome]